MCSIRKEQLDIYLGDLECLLITPCVCHPSEGNNATDYKVDSHTSKTACVEVHPSMTAITADISYRFYIYLLPTLWQNYMYKLIHRGMRLFCESAYDYRHTDKSCFAPHPTTLENN